MNAAVIGVGNMGKHHARVFAELEGINLVGIADPSTKIGHELAQKHKCRYYSDYHDLFNNEKIDLVSTAVPTSLHKTVALFCIDRGIPILIEKPIAESIEAAEEIIKASTRKNVPVCIGHIERFNPIIQKLKNLIEQGRFGRIISISTKRIGLFPPQIKDTDVILDLAVHDIDICHFLLQRHPTTIDARAGKALNSKRFDYADIIMGYNGVDVVIQVNWITPVKVRELSLIGTKGYAALNYLTQTLRIYKSNYTKKFDSYGDYIVKFGTPHTEELNLAGKEPLKIEIENFVEHIKHQKSNIVSARDGLRALHTALEAAKAAERNRRKSK